MNYYADRPIENKASDLLGRSSFSEKLSKAIGGYDARDGLVIGIYGKWGDGKTSIVNMILENLNNNSKVDKPLIIKFDPWNYSDKSNLISIFFSNLSKELENKASQYLKKTISVPLNNYSIVIDTLSFVPGEVGVAASVSKPFFKKISEIFNKTPSMNEAKRNLEKALIRADKKIIVVIDDIDRLTNTQIRDIFQLVKQVGDFPNVIYMLVMERDVVSRALTEVHNVDGNKYMEKIIQIPIPIPKLDKSKVIRIFDNYLEEVINKLPIEFVLDENYWYSIKYNCIEPYINNLRDVNRVINIFQFKYSALYNEVCFEDMIAITTIEVLEPKLYEWIIANKNEICGEVKNNYNLTNSSGEWKRDYYSEFLKLGIEPNLATNFVATVFPVFSNYLGKYNSFTDIYSNIRSKKRVAHIDKFDIYFSFNINELEISSIEIEDIINYLDEGGLLSYINDINQRKKILDLLYEIDDAIYKIPYNRLRLISSVILTEMWKFDYINNKSIFLNSVSFVADSTVNKLLKRLNTEEERFEVIKESLSKVNKDGLSSIGIVINRIEGSYARLEGGFENKDNQIISLKHLDMLEDIFIERLKNIENYHLVFSLKDFGFILYFWERIDEEGVKDYLDKALIDDITKLKFFCGLAGIWRGNIGQGWTFYEKLYDKYVTKEEIYNLIKKPNKKYINELTTQDNIKLATFALNIENKNDRVTEEEALLYIEHWKS